MEAQVGDRIVIHSLHVGEPPRDGEIIEVAGEIVPPEDER